MAALTLLAGTLLLTPIVLQAGTTSDLVDDFSNPELLASGAPRMVITDQVSGGQSQVTKTIADGVIAVQGKLMPGRGAPGFVSLPLTLAANGTPRDLSQYEGVRLRVKVTQGSLTIQVSSSDIVNYDYHTSKPIVRDSDGLKEVRIPFTELKRAWSEQTPLNLKTITSVNLLTAGMAPGSFSYEVDEVGFY